MKATITLVLSMVPLVLISCAAPMPDNLGVRGDKLSPCSKKPNCVSSYENDKKHDIAPLPGGDNPTAELKRAGEIIRTMKGATVITETDTYIHSQYRSSLFGFIDDLELLVDKEEKVIHVRSASRVGYSDLGANRTRVEALRTAMEKK